MLNETIEQLEAMTEEQQNELLKVQFPEDMVKQAEAEVNTMALAEACYALGGLKAERALAEAEGIDKVASAEDVAAHDAAVVELGEDIDSLVGDLGIAQLEDPIALHKEAQAAAGLIFQGYADTLEKMAAGKFRAAAEKLMGHARSAGGHMGKHKKKYIGGAAGLATLGTAAAVHHHMKKKASELTGSELLELMDAREEFALGLTEVEEGSVKLAEAAAGRGAAFAAKLKAVAKHKATHIGAAGAGGLTAGYMAGSHGKK